MDLGRLRRQVVALVAIHEQLTRLELSETTVAEIERLRQAMLVISEWQQNMMVELASDAGIESLQVFGEFRDIQNSGQRKRTDADARLSAKQIVKRLAQRSSDTPEPEGVRDP